MMEQRIVLIGKDLLRRNELSREMNGFRQRHFVEHRSLVDPPLGMQAGQQALARIQDRILRKRVIGRAADVGAKDRPRPPPVESGQADAQGQEQDQAWSNYWPPRPP